MSKPFVVVIPASKRERLRNSGGAEFNMFEPFDIRTFSDSDDEGFAKIYLWPYDVNYDLSSINAASGEINIPAFFGLGTAANDDQKRNNERAIAGLLNSVIIHIVFLDKRDNGQLYPEFKSIKEITLWAEKLREGLDIRFRNEYQIQNIENVLVVVTGAEQVTATKDELEEFEECIGKGKLFESCYLLGYNIRVGESHNIPYSEEVWDIVIRRLLLAFMLSRPEDEHGRGWWQKPGIKVWRSLDCGAVINRDSERKFVNEVLTNSINKLRQMLVQGKETDLSFFKGITSCKDSLSKDIAKLQPSDTEVPEFNDDGKSFAAFNDNNNKSEGRLLKNFKSIFAKWYVNLPPNALKAKWRKEPKGGWSEFNAEDCVSKTKDGDGSRWGNGFEDIRKKYAEWRVKNSSKIFIDANQAGSEGNDTRDEARRVFGFIHNSPGYLFKFIDELYIKLSEPPSADHTKQSLIWTSLVRAESDRKLAISQLGENAVEFEKAQSRYVGWGVGILVFASVSVMFGWVSYRLSAALLPLVGISGPVVFLVAFLLFFCISLGSLFAVIVMVGCHNHAGRRAMAALLEDSILADMKMSYRDKKAREIVSDGVDSCRSVRLQGVRFRMWAILKRLESMLLNEIKPSTSIVKGGHIDTDAYGSGNSFRESFLKETRRIFPPLELELAGDEKTQENINEIVKKWWVSPPEQDAEKSSNSFMELWHQFALLDSEATGYYPAKEVIPKLRSFVSKFLDAVRLEAISLAIEHNNDELRKNINKWFEDIKTDTWSYVSSAITAKHVKENVQSNPIIYFANNNNLIDGQLEESVKNENYSFEKHEFMGKTPYLGLLYKEFTVHLDSDRQNNLIFKVVEDGGI